MPFFARFKEVKSGWLVMGAEVKQSSSQSDLSLLAQPEISGAYGPWGSVMVNKLLRTTGVGCPVVRGSQH